MKRIGLLAVIATSFLFSGLTLLAQQSPRVNVNSVAILRWYAANLTASFPVGAGPGAAAFDGSNMWVTNNTSNDVSKLRASDALYRGGWVRSSNLRRIRAPGLARAEPES